VGSVLLLYEPITLVAFAVFAAVSLVILRWLPGRPGRPARLAAPAGMKTAAIAGIVSGVLVAVALLPLVFIGLAFGGPLSNPVGAVLGGFGIPVLVVAGSVVFAVLDLYAIQPPRPGDPAGAVKRALLAQSLVLAVILVGGGIRTSMETAAAEQALADQRAAWAAEMRAVEARSTGLSVAVYLVDATLGERTADGRVVTHLTLDVTIRSATAIELRQATEGLTNQGLWLEPPYGPYVDVHDGLSLPTHIPAGLAETYRLDVPVSRSDEYQDPQTTGQWEATLNLIGPDSSLESPISHQAKTTFDVPDTP
jgi:hypothetical protein